MKLIPGFVRKLDRYLLLNHPELWLLEFHYVHLWAFVATLLLVPIAWWPMDIAHVPNPDGYFSSGLFLSGGAGLVWVIRQLRGNRHWPYQMRMRWWPRVLGFWYCLMVFVLPPLIFAYMTEKNISRLSNLEQLLKDEETETQSRSCIPSSLEALIIKPRKSDCTQLLQQRNTLLNKYGITAQDDGELFRDSLSFRIRLLIRAHQPPKLSRELACYYKKDRLSPECQNANDIDTFTHRSIDAYETLLATLLTIAIVLFASRVSWEHRLLVFAPVAGAVVLIFLADAEVVSFPTLNITAACLLLTASAFVLISKRKSPWSVAAWGTLNLCYPAFLLLTLPNPLFALPIYLVTLPILQRWQEHLRARPA